MIANRAEEPAARTARQMQRVQFTLRRFSVAVAVAGVTLGLIVQNPQRMVGLLPVTILVAAGVTIVYRFCPLPRWIRLTVEVAVLLALVVITVIERCPPHLVQQACRAAEAARFAKECAHAAESVETQRRFLRWADWFSDRAAVFTGTAIWYGLTGGWPGLNSDGALGDAELLRELELARSIELLKDAARRSRTRPHRAPSSR